MTSDLSFADVITRLRSGDQDAAAQIFRRYVHQLTALARGKLHPRLQAKADPEDVVQSVYRSFFNRDCHKPFDLTDWNGLWGLLARITLCKCSDRHQYWKAARRNVDRETVPLPNSNESGCWWEAIDHGPTPDQATALNETLESLFRKLDVRERPIAEALLYGFTAAEAATRCRRSERTVARVSQRLKLALQKLEADESSD